MCLCGLLAAFVRAAPADTADFRILVFTKTEGFRHSSIPHGVAALEKLARENGFALDHTEDAAVFTPKRLRQYQAVVFLLTTGNVLDESQQQALERYIQAGGGYVGIHSASDTELEWPWYAQLVGAQFRDHPAIQEADVIRMDPSDPSTAHLPDTWTRTDEWYNFRAAPDQDQLHLLLRLDESTYEGGKMGELHPLSWRQEYDGGRSWYTAMGHTEESYEEPKFLQHILAGIRYAAGK